MNYTYILECEDGSYYTGWTNNLERRFEMHKAGKGAKYTKGHKPVRIAYYEIHETKYEALKREKEIKHMSHAQKKKMIESK